MQQNYFSEYWNTNKDIPKDIVNDIKRIIKKDLNFLFSNKQANSNKNREIIYNESHIILTNKRYNIRYSLKPFIK